VRVMVPAALDCNDLGEKGWVVLVGATYPPLVVAFCWSKEHAMLVFNAIGGQAKGYYVTPAFLNDVLE